MYTFKFACSCCGDSATLVFSRGDFLVPVVVCSDCDHAMVVQHIVVNPDYAG